MKKLIAAGLVLSPVFIALIGEVHAYANYPWCIIGYRRGVDCYFRSRSNALQRGGNSALAAGAYKIPFTIPHYLRSLTEHVQLKNRTTAGINRTAISAATEEGFKSCDAKMFDD
jgi:hypothetical protein